MRALAAVFLVACSCGEPAPPPRAAPPPADPSSGRQAFDERDAGFEWLMLHDIQGLHGGRAVYVLPSGRVVVQLVTPSPTEGLVERRFEVELDRAALADIGAVLQEHDLASMQVEDRPGIPDEARAVLAVRFDDGRAHRVAKWEGVQHAGFSAIYGHVMRIANDSASMEPTHVGDYDWRWRPAGAPWPEL